MRFAVLLALSLLPTLPGGPLLNAGEADPGELPIVRCDRDDGAPDLEFIRTLGRVVARPAQGFLRVPVFLSSTGDILGLSISLYAPPESVLLLDLDLSGTMLASVRAVANPYLDLREEGYIALSMVFDAPLPVLPYPGAVVAHLEFAVQRAVLPGTEVLVEFRELPGGDGERPVRNEILLSEDAEVLVLEPCGMVLEVAPENELFVRGDANRDWIVNLPDAIAILGHLFDSQVGPELPCLEAADVDDNGLIMITDVVQLLSFLFSGGALPQPPFPYPGRESPVDDSVPCIER
jgi:hypothetical protein